MKPRNAPAGRFTYVCHEDRALPPAQQTVFRCKPMDIDWQARAMDEAAIVDGGTVRLRNHQVALDIVRAHLVAVDNFAAGRWPADGTEDERNAYLAQIGPAAIRELGHALWDHCSIDTRPDDAPPEARSLGESSP